MSDDEQILTPAQRHDLAAFAETGPAEDMEDADLLSLAAGKIGMTGELAVDPDGVLELQRDNLLVALEMVPEEERDDFEHADLLHLSIMLSPASEEERAELERSELLEPGEARHGENGEWINAWWGSMSTNLHRTTGIARQMEALERVMTQAEAVVERGSIDGFFEALVWLRAEDDEDDDDDDIEVEIIFEDDDGEEL
ncbi:hypothetical protein BH23GEM9_BH23GEM9_06830 [soil metagenome]